jgi:hypothetical protein
MAYSTINKPSNHFDIQLNTGTNTSGRTFTGLNFQPDFIWTKVRDSANYNHALVDRVRGGNKFLFSNSTSAEDVASHGQITSWNSDGTTWSDGTNGTYPRLYYNDAGQLGGSGSRVWWNWKANGAGVSNTQGTISSTVSANTTAGFSIVTYTGNGTSGATIGHGLGAVPAFTIVKNRSLGGRNFQGFHKSLGNTKSHLINSTEVPRTNSVFWNNTSPTSTLITLGNDADVNESGQSFIAYCFAEVKGFSKFGSYTGNGSTDGTFVYTGFKPAFVIIKRTDSAGYDWLVYDNKRQVEYNVVDDFLKPNLSDAETTGNAGQSLDFLSNGIKFRGTGASSNASGGTFIYMAFAEQPLVGTNNVPATAR